MNVEELNKSIRELESQLAAYSTPKTQQGSVTTTGHPVRDTRYDLAEESALKTERLPPILTRERGATAAQWSPIDFTDGVRKKSVKFEDTPVREKQILTPEDEKYSLNKYLVKNRDTSSSLQPDESNESQNGKTKLQDSESKVTNSKQAQDKQETKSESEPVEKCKDQTEYRKPPVLIKPATYDGLSSWLDYKSHFEACAG